MDLNKRLNQGYIKLVMLESWLSKKNSFAFVQQLNGPSLNKNQSAFFLHWKSFQQVCLGS